uniref:(northern house mosquito) hypothetical protein n=1 Tax=Culex pipiens TaxID=7175 RepID=A0A8D8A8D9_CULPI
MNTLKCRPGTPSSSDWNRSEPAFLQRNASLFRVKSTEGSSRVQRSSAFDSGLNIFRLFAPVLRKLGRDVAIWSWMSLYIVDPEHGSQEGVSHEAAASKAAEKSGNQGIQSGTSDDRSKETDFPKLSILVRNSGTFCGNQVQTH